MYMYMDLMYAVYMRRMNGHVTSRHVTNDTDFAQSNWLNIIDLLISQVCVLIAICRNCKNMIVLL